ncbi:hypothetical protein BC940DRAFT_296155 [Gongronella butleri]|nr:hypothetical protein BC940DRAFT_296155 [Gongronella butleri]
MTTKKVPCDECRARKRRCSYEHPCARCVKFNMDCVYTVLTSPADEEYLQQIKYLDEFEQLQLQLDGMEQEMKVLQLSHGPLDVMSSPSTISSSSMPSTIVTRSSSNTFSSTTTISTDSRTVKRQRTSDGLVATLSHYIYDPETAINESSSDNDSTNGSKTSETVPHEQWSLQISKNGSLMIHTNIKSHSELLDCLHNGLRSVQEQQHVPNFLSNHRPRDPLLSHIVQIFVWKRYGRSRLKNIALGFTSKGAQRKALRLKKNANGIGCPSQDDYINNGDDISNDDNEMDTDTTPLFHDALTADLVSLTRTIYDAYVNCEHMNHIHIHTPTFERLFCPPSMNSGETTDALSISPALLALCAVACTSNCKHLYTIVPVGQRMKMGAFFADEARAKVIDMFDEPTLETLTTYTMLSLYKLRRADDADCEFFATMAERISPLVKEHLPRRPSEIDTVFDDLSMDPQDILVEGLHAHYDRVAFQLGKVQQIVAFHKHQHRMIRRGQMHDTADRRLVNKFHDRVYPVRPTRDDTQLQRRHLRLHGYIRDFNKECHDTAHQAPADNTDDYVGIMGHMIEMAMRRWYAALPNTYKLDLPLFDPYAAIHPSNATTNNGISSASSVSSSDECRWLQVLEDAPDVVPLLSTLNVYNEFMLMAMAHLCRTPADLVTCEQIATYWKENYQNIDYEYLAAQFGQKWSIKLKKMESMLQWKVKEMHKNCTMAHDDCDRISDPALAHLPSEIAALVTILTSTFAGFDDPSARVAVTSALNAIQLLQFLRLRHPCYFDLRVAANVWSILLRALKFGFGGAAMRDTLQSNLICCLAMIRDEINWLPDHLSMMNFVRDMEQQYKEEFE